LHRSLIDERLLDVADGTLGVTEAFEGQDGFSLGPDCHIDAGVERPAVDQDGACTAFTYVTAVLDAVQTSFATEHIG